MNDIEFLIRKKTIATGKKIFIFGIIIFIFGILITIGTVGQGASGIIIGILFAVIGAIMPVIAVTRKLMNPEENPLIMILDGRTDDQPVWIYHIEIRSTLFVQSYQIAVRTLQKKQLNLMVKKKEVDPILEYFQSRFPNATFGYSKEVEQAYRDNPASLLNG